MKIYLFPGCLAILFLMYCTSPESKNRAYHIVPMENPVFYPDTVFQGTENLSSPKFAALKKTYQLDTVFQGKGHAAGHRSALPAGHLIHLIILNFAGHKPCGSHSYCFS